MTLSPPTLSIINSLSGPASSLGQRTPMTMMHGRLVRKRHHSMPFLRRNASARGIGRRGSRHNGSQSHSRKRARQSLEAYAEKMMPVAPSNPQPLYPKKTPTSLSTMNQSNEVSRRRSTQEYVPSGSRASSDTNSVLLLTDDGNAKGSAFLLSGAPLSSLLGVKPNSVQSRSEINTAQIPNHLPQAYFHYLFMQPNNVPATIVEEVDGRVCPLCNFDGKNNEGLLNHCGTYHGTLHGTNRPDNPCEIMTKNNVDCAYFEAVMGEERQLHVIVRGVPMRSSHLIPTKHSHDNFIYIGQRFYKTQSNTPSFIEQQIKVPYLQRHPEKVASLDGATRSKRLLALQSSDAPASVTSAYLPSDTIPIRQYYHSHTNLPMINDDWMGDSDDDIDEDWVQEMSSELLDEFEDVSSEEKQFMIIWNRFIKSNHVIGDRHMPDKCDEFILKNRKQLIDAGLRVQLLLHLFHLWDSGVISSNRIRRCMTLFDGTTNTT